MSAPSTVLTFAHRGGRAHGPDNRIETFQRALAGGAAGLETDAWLTADGEVVLDHDGVHRAARRVHKPIAEVRRGELPAHVPTLGELYSACGTDFDLAVDVRLVQVASAIVDVARAHGATNRLWLVADAADHLGEWRSLSDDVHLAVTLHLRNRRTTRIEEAQRAGAEALNMRWPWWSRRLVHRLHAVGMLCFAYDAQRRWSVERCIRLGVDGLFSDRVELLTTAAAYDCGPRPEGREAASS